MTRSWWLSRRKGACCEGTCDAGANEETLEFAVEGMNCSHCSSSVTRVVEELEGVTACRVDLEGGRAVVTGPGLAPDRILAVISGLGFTPTLKN
jgi:copper chaperone CopZ